MTPITSEIEFEPLLESKHNGKHVLNSLLPILGAVKVKVSVNVGGAELSVADLVKLEQGAVLALDRNVEEPLDIVVDSHVVARGMLVAVGDHFGIRITETATIAQGALATATV